MHPRGDLIVMGGHIKRWDNTEEEHTAEEVTAGSKHR